MDSTWHILRVSPGQERVVSDATDVPTYFPTRTVRRFNRRYRVWNRYDEPLFPGYLFVQTDFPRDVRIRTVGQRNSYLRNGDRTYATISGSQMLSLRSIEAQFTEESNARKHPFNTGDRVEFASGSLTGVQAIVAHIKGENELVVLIDGGFPVRVSTVASHLKEAIAA